MLDFIFILTTILLMLLFAKIGVLRGIFFILKAAISAIIAFISQYYLSFYLTKVFVYKPNSGSYYELFVKVFNDNLEPAAIKLVSLSLNSILIFIVTFLFIYFILSILTARFVRFLSNIAIIKPLNIFFGSFIGLFVGIVIILLTSHTMGMISLISNPVETVNFYLFNSPENLIYGIDKSIIVDITFGQTLDISYQASIDNIKLSLEILFNFLVNNKV